jgi:hypothetical protein
MESIPQTKRDNFMPSDLHMEVLTSIFNMEETIIDPEFNNTHICLSE